MLSSCRCCNLISTGLTISITTGVDMYNMHDIIVTLTNLRMYVHYFEHGAY